MAELLAERGWQIPAMRILIQADPFDATRGGADLVLATDERPEDNAARFVQAVVGRELSQWTQPAVAQLLADLVAAKLAPAGAEWPLAWQEDWLERLSFGDLTSTALPEALWRYGSDEAIRVASKGAWPGEAFRVLRNTDQGTVEAILGEVALAGLLDPSRLGFDVGVDLVPRLLGGGQKPEIRRDGPALRLVPVISQTGAAAVSAWRLRHASAWLVVRYAFSRDFDAVPLNTFEEIPVPLQGVLWAAVAVVATEPDSQVSLNTRPVDGYPLELEGWDFRTGEAGVNLSWETIRHSGVDAYLVDAVAGNEEEGFFLARRTVVPVAEDGSRSRAYAFTDEDMDGISYYRLLAITDRGLVAEVGVFPVAAALR